MYEVLGLFVLLLVGVMLLSEGGHLAHLSFFGHAVETMSKGTFYFVIAVLVLVDLVQAALAETIGQVAISSDQHDRIPLRVATTLFEDPICHPRLVAFWSRLLATRK